MPRPIWKGYITFGLVNIPVVLYSAEKKSDINFKLVDMRDNARIRYERINEETGKKVDWEKIAKGYEYDDNSFVIITEEELKQIAGENTKTINIESFVDKNSIPSIDFERPYYLVPDTKGEKGYVILREALKDSKQIGITKVIIHTREYLAALMPYKNALVLNLLRYHQAIKQPDEFDLPSENLKTYKVTTKEMDIAKQLIKSMSSSWKPNDFKDEYRIALEKWIDEKINTSKPHSKMKSRAKSPLKKSNIVNFVELMKKSMPSKKKRTPKNQRKFSRRKRA